MNAGNAKGPGEGDDRLPARGDAAGPPEVRLALEPLRELAAAFQANQKALREIAEGQLRIAKRIERADRSEAIVQSTQTLNETFRGVQRTQERLISRIEGDRKRPFLFLVLGLAAAGALVGGLLWFLLGWVAERDRLAGSESVEVLSRELVRKDESVEELREKLFARSEELLRQTNLTAEQKSVVEGLRGEVASLTERNRELGKNRDGLSEALRENARLTTEAAEADRRAAEANTALSREQDRNRELSRKVDDLVRQLAERPATPAAPPSAAPAAATPSAAGGAQPSASPPASEPADRDPASMARLAETLNRLLEASKGSRTVKFLSIGGARGKVLLDVVVADIDAEGREAKRIVGAEARLALDSRVRRVEIRLKDGHIVYYGVKAPFWGGQYVVPVVNVNADAWRNSGLTVVEEAQ